MGQEPVVIPEKIYFKIGEVCELVGVQAHVLRYWESEFPTLSPQKNQSGQRSYRRRDVEIALRIKQLLYKELFTIAGAIKKLQSEQREISRAKAEAAEQVPKPAVERSRTTRVEAPTLFDDQIDESFAAAETSRNTIVAPEFDGRQRDALKLLGSHLLELREMLKTSQTKSAATHLKNG